MADFGYTVGTTVEGEGWYVRMPWHLRGSWYELSQQLKEAASLSDGCVGLEYWDGHVQFQRYLFPWLLRGQPEQAAPSDITD